jgi:hypothetical protein
LSDLAYVSCIGALNNTLSTGKLFKLANGAVFSMDSEDFTSPIVLYGFYVLPVWMSFFGNF